MALIQLVFPFNHQQPISNMPTGDHHNRYPASLADLFNRDFTIGYHHFEPLSKTLDRLVNNEFDSFGRRFEVTEKDGVLTLEFELPGFKQSELSLEFKNGLLTIGAKNARDSVERSVTVGNDIDADKIEAQLENGVLTVTLPKLASAKPRKVTVRQA